MNVRQDSKWMTILIIAIILSSILLLRTFKEKAEFINGESYFHLRMAHEILLDPLINQDDLQNRAYHPNIYHFFLAVGLNFFGLDKTIHFMPIMLGVLSALLFFRLLTNLGLPKSNANFSALLLIATPAFLVTYSTISQNGMVLFLSLLSLTLYFEKAFWDTPWLTSGKIYYSGSIIVLCLLGLTSLVGFGVTILFLFLFSIMDSKNFSQTIIPPAISLLLFIPFFIFTEIFQLEIRSSGFHAFDIRQTFTIFGATLGIDLFLFILFITGMIILWRLVSHLRIYHLFSMAFISASFFNPLLELYASLLIAVYCVVAIKHLFYSKWELELVKSGTILLLLCTLLFSTLSQSNALVNSEPGKETLELFSFLKAQPDGVVMSAPEYGFAIQYLSQKETMLDDMSHHYTDFYDIEGDYRYMLGLVRLKEAEPMLSKYKIKYILLTPEIKENFWSGRDQGLLLILKNSGKFEKIKEISGYELWKYNPGLQEIA